MFDLSVDWGLVDRLPSNFCSYCTAGLPESSQLVACLCCSSGAHGEQKFWAVNVVKGIVTRSSDSLNLVSLRGDKAGGHATLGVVVLWGLIGCLVVMLCNCVVDIFFRFIE